MAMACPEFPELRAAAAASSKTKMWAIRVFEQKEGSCVYGVIETTHGYTDGKKQVNQKTITNGKNIGKKNETTPLQQAISEAQAAWVKKHQTGYTAANRADEAHQTGQASKEDCEARAAAPHSKLVQRNAQSLQHLQDDLKAQDFGSIPACMLAHDYTKRGKSIVFPCFVQRKFDGTRCIGIANKGLFSRNKKPYPHLHHIMKDINTLNELYNQASNNAANSNGAEVVAKQSASSINNDVVLDGELYSDSLTFQEIVSVVKRAALQKGDDKKQLKVKYFVYDLVDTKPFKQRLDGLTHVFASHKFKYLQLVDTAVCNSEEHMKELHAQYVAEGYEGIMLRNANSSYKHARSADLQKYKHFIDDEFKVVGFNQGEGQEAGCVIWVCETTDNKTFACRPRGTREARAVLFQNGSTYIGKMLTVRFQELTDTGIPRFPVGIAFRDYE